jgi:hypothetical protein
MKITKFCLYFQKVLLFLLPNVTYNSWAKNQQLFLNKIKGSALYGGGLETIHDISPSVCDVHTYGGRCCFITILKIMNVIKNYFDWLLDSEDGLTDYQVFILMQKGGAL